MSLVSRIQRSGSAAALAALVALHVAPAQAGEISVTNCLHGFANAYRYSTGHEYGAAYSSDDGRSYSDSRGFTVPSRGGFGGRFRAAQFDGRFIDRSSNRNGSADTSASGATSSNGYNSGYDSEYGVGSNRADGSDSCVEIRRELTNPYVIQVQQPQTPEEIKAADDRDRLWRDRCHPVIKQDSRGVPRYAYAAPGCEYGKYE